MFIFNFDYSPTMPIVESQLQMVIDYCNDTSEVKNAILYYHSNETHSIDNIDCEWKLHQNYPNSEYLCIPYVEKWVTSEEWRNQTHIFDKDSCKWKKDPEHDELNSIGCPQFCPKESIPEPDVTDSLKIPNLVFFDELVDLGCTEPAINHVSRYSNLLDDSFDGTYYIEWIGLPDDLSQVELDKCVKIILEKRISVGLENEN